MNASENSPVANSSTATTAVAGGVGGAVVSVVAIFVPTGDYKTAFLIAAPVASAVIATASDFLILSAKEMLRHRKIKKKRAEFSANTDALLADNNTSPEMREIAIKLKKEMDATNLIQQANEINRLHNLPLIELGNIRNSPALPPAQ